MEPDQFFYIESFIHTLKVITRDLSQKFPNDAKIIRIKKRIFLAVEHDPIFIMNSVGSLLYKYKDQIYDTTGTIETFFLNKDYSEDVSSINNPDDEKIEMINYLIPKIKEYASQLSLPDKDQYGDFIINLLDNYIEYLFLANRSGQYDSRGRVP